MAAQKIEEPQDSREASWRRWHLKSEQRPMFSFSLGDHETLRVRAFFCPIRRDAFPSIYLVFILLGTL